MCIIAIKDKGLIAPYKKTLKTCFENNSDGAGLMFNDGKGNVIIKKGFMTFKKFWKYHQSIPDKQDKTIIYHFRITTHGGTNPYNCHPFPIAGEKLALKSLSIKTDIGIAHNGVIHINPIEKGLSDTMQFIKDILYCNYDKISKKDEQFFNFVRQETKGSRLVFLYPDGTYIRTGETWQKDKETQILYSNNTYKEMRYAYDDVYDYYFNKHYSSLKGNREILSTDGLLRDNFSCSSPSMVKEMDTQDDTVIYTQNDSDNDTDFYGDTYKDYEETGFYCDLCGNPLEYVGGELICPLCDYDIYEGYRDIPVPF